MKLQKFISKVLDVLTALVLLLFFASFGFKDSRSSGWYQQFFPNLNGSSITSMTFLDSLTGFAVTSLNTDTNCFILKTTNGGDNWNIIFTYHPIANTISLNKIQFANSSIGYASTNYYDFFRTTNSGLNWIDLPNVPEGADDMAVLNKDSILCVMSSPLIGGVFRSTNSGQSWQRIWNAGGTNQNPSSIYMFNKNLGFHWGSSGMRRTSDGGFNWTAITGENYSGIQMIDTLIGWKTAGSSLMMKTINGGVNWFQQQVPNFNNGYYNPKLCIINYDTVWMVGEIANPGPIFKTTNGGLNWGYQFPGPYLVSFYDYIIFIDNNKGWAYRSLSTFEIHTKIGGNDTTFFTSVNQNNPEIANNFILEQNYPNPFNAKTKIKYRISKSANIKIKIFDIQGKEIKTLIDKQQNQGDYLVIFDGSNLPSGIYFYRIETDKFTAVKKMVLIK